MEATVGDFRNSSIGDAEVVKRVLAGEIEMFEIIMRRYNQRLYRAARAILGNDIEAEQVMQDAYFQAYTHLAQFAGKAKFSTWLTKIAVYEALARLRRRKRFVDLDSLSETEKGMRTLISAEQSPEQKAISSELKTLLEKAVERLPERFRSVLVLRDVEGLDTSETSECLGISEENVKVRLHRARGLVREHLHAEFGIAGSELFSFQQKRCDRIVESVMARIRQAKNANSLV
jgi:RNA polymerase sigma-70 factor, ECF subfamily